MSRRRRLVAALAILAGAGAPLVSGSEASRADDGVVSPTGLTVAFAGWHDGRDRMLVAWDPPAAPVGHVEVDVIGGIDPTAQFTVPGDQDSALVDVATAANPVLHNQLIVTAYAWSADGTTRSGPSNVVLTPSVLGAQLTGGVGSGATGQGRLSWPAPASGDVLLLRQVVGVGDPFTTGLPVVIDGTRAGSVDVPADPSGHTAQYALYEQVVGDAEQRSPASLASGQAAPDPVLNVSAAYAEDGRSVQVSWDRPASCPAAYWLTHCMVVRVVVRKGRRAPVSPSDGQLRSPASDQPGVESYGTTVTGLTPGRVYRVAVFTTPYGRPGDYGPAVTLAAHRDLLTPQLAIAGPSSTTVTYGEAATLPVLVTGWDGVTPLAGSMVQVLDVGQPKRPAVVASGTTPESGELEATLIPRFTTHYAAATLPTATYRAGRTSADDVVVRVRPTLGLAANHASVAVGRKVSLSGTIAPHLATTVTLQRHTATGWHTVAATRSSASGRYAFRYLVPAKGTVSYRIRRPGDSRLETGVSGTVKVKGT